MAKTISVKGKVYTMPEVGKKEYFEYLKEFDKLMKKDKKGEPYDYDDYVDMANCIAMIYNNQFKGQDIIDDDEIMVEDIIANFMYVEIAKNLRVNNKMDKYKKAFQNGKGTKRK